MWPEGEINEYNVFVNSSLGEELETKTVQVSIGIVTHKGCKRCRGADCFEYGVRHTFQSFRLVNFMYQCLHTLTFVQTSNYLFELSSNEKWQGEAITVWVSPPGLV